MADKNYIGVEIREEKWKDIVNKATEIFSMSLPGTITADFVPGRPIPDGVDGFVNMKIPSTFVFGDDIMKLFMEMLKEVKSEVKNSLDAKVELIIEHTPESTNLIFRVPDVWIEA